MSDNIAFTISEDGAVSIQMDKLSAANRASADSMLAEIHKLMGGQRTVEPRKPLVQLSSTTTQQTAVQ